MTKKTQHIFQINYTSEDDDKHYIGDFSCRRLSIKDYQKLNVLKATYNGGMHYSPDRPGYGVDRSTEYLGQMLAHLEVALVVKPDWWNLNEISDMDLLGKVFHEVMLFENSFREGGDVPLRSGKAGSQGSGQVSNGGTSPSSVVDQKVQAPLDP